MGTCMKGTAYVINVILLLHVVHAFGIHMSCVWTFAILLPLLGKVIKPTELP